MTCFVVLVNFLNSFLFDEIPDCPAIHYLHEIGFEVIESEAKVEIVLWISAHIIKKLIGFGLDNVLENTIDFVFFVIINVVGLMLFGQSQTDLFRLHSLILLYIIRYIEI